MTCEMMVATHTGGHGSRCLGNRLVLLLVSNHGERPGPSRSRMAKLVGTDFVRGKLS